jgi:hypothetical protein
LSITFVLCDKATKQHPDTGSYASANTDANFQDYSVIAITTTISMDGEKFYSQGRV